MKRKMYIVVFIIIFCMSLFPSSGYAEYIKAEDVSKNARGINLYTEKFSDGTHYISTSANEIVSLCG